jgi:hypothetical protein
VPNSISPATWIPGFSDVYKSKSDFMCAIAITDADLIKKMTTGCCKGAVQTDASGCYHWCKPDAKDLTDWATCISDKVYTDTNFGQACNVPGGLELKSALSQNEKAPPGTTGGAAGLSASWKVGVFVGVVALVQAMC